MSGSWRKAVVCRGAREKEPHIWLWTPAPRCRCAQVLRGSGRWEGPPKSPQFILGNLLREMKVKEIRAMGLVLLVCLVCVLQWELVGQELQPIVSFAVSAEQRQKAVLWLLYHRQNLFPFLRELKFISQGNAAVCWLAGRHSGSLAELFFFLVHGGH